MDNKAGLASIFKPGRKSSLDMSLSNLSEFSLNCSSSSLETVTSSIYSESSNQPKKSTLSSAFGFIAKHRAKTMSASLKYVTSHMEFTASLLDVVEMRNRLEKIRALEEPDEVERRRRLGTREGQPTPPRTGFVNYYTASVAQGKGGKPSNDTCATAGVKWNQCSSVDNVMPSELPSRPDSKNILTGELKEFEAGQLGCTKSSNIAQNEVPYSGKPEERRAWKSTPKLRRKPRSNTEKIRTFCVIPKKGDARDPSWVETRIEGDEVSAHCGLFFVEGEEDCTNNNISPIGKCAFDRLLGDVATTILEWTQRKN